MALLVFILATLGVAAGRRMGTPIAVVGGFFGAALGWALARAVMRKIF
jgi:hypothetical protein